MREDISFFFRKWIENESDSERARQYDIRYRFLLCKFYEIMHNDLGKAEYKNAYETAEQKYDALFPITDNFSMNRKT